MSDDETVRIPRPVPPEDDMTQPMNAPLGLDSVWEELNHGDGI